LSHKHALNDADVKAMKVAMDKSSKETSAVADLKAIMRVKVTKGSSLFNQFHSLSFLLLSLQYY